LFIPADRPDFIAKAPSRGADAIILDLEDAVAPQAKAQARAALADAVPALTGQGLTVWLRINAPAEGGLDDLAAAQGAGVTTVMIPKCDALQDIRELAVIAGPAMGLVPLIEDPRGLAQAGVIGSAPQVKALAFGSEDFAASLGVEPSPLALSTPAQMLVLAAAAAGRPAYGLPGSLAQFRDLEAFSVVAERAAALGFSGAMAIHPAQVAVLHRAFAPSPKQRAWAEAILRAAEGQSGGQGGATAAEGEMIDRPIILRAQRIMAKSLASPL
jgi:citrate lyase subunit beta/citryl-CoA lyase